MTRDEKSDASIFLLGYSFGVISKLHKKLLDILPMDNEIIQPLLEDYEFIKDRIEKIFYSDDKDKS